MAKNFSIHEVFELFIREYFKNILYDILENESILRLKREFNLSNKELFDTIKKVDSEYNSGLIQLDYNSSSGNDFNIFKSVVTSISENGKISYVTDEILKKVASGLMISENMYLEILDSSDISLSKSNNANTFEHKEDKDTNKKSEPSSIVDIFSCIVDEKNKNSSSDIFDTSDKKIGNLILDSLSQDKQSVNDENPLKIESIATDSKKDNSVSNSNIEGFETKESDDFKNITSNTSYVIKGIRLIRKNYPEFKIFIDIPCLDKIFLDDFIIEIGEVNIFFHTENDKNYFIAASSDAKKILYVQSASEKEIEDFNSVFSPGITNYYSICFMNENQQLTLIKHGEIDLTGDHFKGLSLINSNKIDDGIKKLISASNANNRIYGLCNKIGEYYFDNGHLAKALIFFFKENDNFPFNVKNCKNLSKVFIKRSKLVKVKEYIKKIGIYNPFDFDFIKMDLENLTKNFEKNMEVILSKLMIFMVIYTKNKDFQSLIEEISAKIGLPDLKSLIEENSSEFSSYIIPFFNIINMIQVGFLGFALKELKLFFNDFGKFYSKNIEFRKIVETFFQGAESYFPDKKLKDKLFSIISEVSDEN